MADQSSRLWLTYRLQAQATGQWTSPSQCSDHRLISIDPGRLKIFICHLELFLNTVGMKNYEAKWLAFLITLTFRAPWWWTAIRQCAAQKMGNQPGTGTGYLLWTHCSSSWALGSSLSLFSLRASHFLVLWRMRAGPSLTMTTHCLVLELWWWGAEQITVPSLPQARI